MDQEKTCSSQDDFLAFLLQAFEISDGYLNGCGWLVSGCCYS